MHTESYNVGSAPYRTSHPYLLLLLVEKTDHSLGTDVFGIESQLQCTPFFGRSALISATNGPFCRLDPQTLEREFVLPLLHASALYLFAFVACIYLQQDIGNAAHLRRFVSRFQANTPVIKLPSVGAFQRADEWNDILPFRPRCEFLILEWTCDCGSVGRSDGAVF